MIWLLVIFMMLSMSKYVSLILGYTRSWSELPNNAVGSEYEPKTTVSVLIAARNEEENIEACIHSLLLQNYPKQLLNIIVVDDHSTDRTSKIIAENIVKDKRITLLFSGENEIGKKAAINKAIGVSTSTLIITTDADCTAGPNWIRTLVHLYEKENAVMVLAPVLFNQKKGWLNKTFRLEFLALMASTGATAQQGNPSMCNGANLCYQRSAFNRVNGFSDIDGNPSGDDVFLMLKFQEKKQGAIIFTKSPEAIVKTNAPKTLKAFWQQRKRWLSKKSGYENGLIKKTAYTVFFGNAAMLVALFLAGPWFNKYWVQAAAIIVIAAKIIADRALLKTAANNLKMDFSWIDLLLSEVFLAIYIPVIGLAGNVGSYGPFQT